MTDPKIMAAQIRAWSNVLRQVAATLHHPTDPPHVWHLLVDVERQMRDVASREERA